MACLSCPLRRGLCRSPPGVKSRAPAALPKGKRVGLLRSHPGLAGAIPSNLSFAIQTNLLRRPIMMCIEGNSLDRRTESVLEVE